MDTATAADKGLFEDAQRRKKYARRLNKLKAKRTSWDSHWRDLSEQIQPRRSRFLVSDNRGGDRNQNIVNNTPTRAAAVLAAGMQAGITSPARPWFRLAAPTPELSKVATVMEWLHVVEMTMQEVFARSDIYNGFHTVYGDLGTFGTAALYIEESIEKVISAQVFAIGQYVLALDGKRQVATLFRELSMTAEQVADEFGKDKCSAAVLRLLETDPDAAVLVNHVIEPNADYDHRAIGRRGKKWKSCYFEVVADDQTGFLEEAGYEEFPVMCPRWAVTAADDAYGHSPGMEALGDCKALQLFEKKKAKAFNKVVDPAMVGPATLNANQVSLLPGDVTIVDSMSGVQAFRPAHEIRPEALNAAEGMISATSLRIKEAFYADLWLQLSQQEGTMTAREVAERHEEKMLQLGPVTERVQNELLHPTIDRVFGICLRRGMFPPPPPELQGTELKVEFISIMAQAQKLIGTQGIERLASFVAGLAPTFHDIADTIDTDLLVKEYATMLGVPPSVVRSADALKAIRAAVQRAAAAQAQAQQAQQAAEGAQTLAKTPLDQGTALDAMLPQMGFAGNAGVH